MLAFERRFAWDGYSLKDIAYMLEGNFLPTGAPSPPWLSVLLDILEPGPAAATPDLTFPGALPYAPLFHAFARHAQQQLRQSVADAQYRLLASSAHQQLIAYLYRRLDAACHALLDDRFQSFRAALTPEATGDARSAFIRHMGQDGLLNLFEAYPVAARLCVRLTELWVEAQAEFLTRLAADWDAINACFAEHRTLHQVTHLKIGVSDPHEGGRSVIIVTFDECWQVVYKPRPIGLERYFADLQAWVNARGGIQPLRPLRLVTRPSHGWVEFVAPAPCPDKAAVERFYQRCGMLLCLVYVTGGTDFHQENLIAMGEHPMLLDMEVLLRHRLPGEPEDAAMPDPFTWANQKFSRSVYWTELLPMYHFGGEHATNIGAMGGLSATRNSTFSAPNLPHLGSDVAPASDWAAAVAEGFEHTYRLLLQHRATLRQPDSALLKCQDQTVRFLFRNTALYSKLIQIGCQPRQLRDGIDRSILFDGLSRVMLVAEERPPLWPLLEAERDALEQMDVPIMKAQADSLDLVLPNGKIIPAYFQATAQAMVAARLETLDETDLAFQVRLIRDSLHGYRAYALTPPVANPPAALPTQVSQTPPPVYTTAEALRLGHLLCRQSHTAPDGSRIWFGLNYVATGRRYRLGPLDTDLFTGHGGIALFLAALAHATGEETIHAEARQTVQTLQHFIQGFRNAICIERGQDELAGRCGSLLYLWPHLAHYLGTPDLLEDAPPLALALTDTLLARTPCLGVVNGLAGLLLGLLSLYEAQPDPALLDGARRTGHHLLSHPAFSRDTLQWHTHVGRFEPGFAHGTSGLLYALLRLNRTGESGLDQALLMEILARFHAEVSANMPTSPGWSHGKTGIAWLYLEALRQNLPPIGRYDLDRILEDLLAHFPLATDAPASGNLALLDVFLAAARQGFLVHQTVDSATAMLFARGQYESHIGWPGAPPPGFLHGLAGIGYQLLRLAHPDTYPSVLAFQPVS